MSSSRALRNGAIDSVSVHLELTVNPNHPQTPHTGQIGSLTSAQGEEIAAVRQ